MTDIKDRLVRLAKDYQEIREKTSLCGVDKERVHLLKKSFEELFPEEDVQYYVDDKDDYFVKYTKYDGVKFICLLTREEYENEKKV